MSFHLTNIASLLVSSDSASLCMVSATSVGVAFQQMIKRSSWLVQTSQGTMQYHVWFSAHGIASFRHVLVKMPAAFLACSIKQITFYSITKKIIVNRLGRPAFEQVKQRRKVTRIGNTRDFFFFFLLFLFCIIAAVWTSQKGTVPFHFLQIPNHGTCIFVLLHPRLETKAQGAFHKIEKPRWLQALCRLLRHSDFHGTCRFVLLIVRN